MKALRAVGICDEVRQLLQMFKASSQRSFAKLPQWQLVSVVPDGFQSIVEGISVEYQLHQLLYRNR